MVPHARREAAVKVRARNTEPPSSCFHTDGLTDHRRTEEGEEEEALRDKERHGGGGGTGVSRFYFSLFPKLMSISHHFEHISLPEERR